MEGTWRGIERVLGGVCGESTNMTEEGQGPALQPLEPRGSRGLIPYCLM